MFTHLYRRRGQGLLAQHGDILTVVDDQPVLIKGPAGQ